MKPPLKIFTHKGKKVILRPGNTFTIIELKSRLDQMNIQYDPSLSKKNLIDLYDKALKLDKNQIKIFDKLIKDTLYYDKTLNILERPNTIEAPLKINNPNKVTIIDNTTIFRENLNIIEAHLKSFKLNIENNINTKDIHQKTNINETNLNFNKPNNDNNINTAVISERPNINETTSNINIPNNNTNSKDNKPISKEQNIIHSESNINFVYIIIILVFLWHFQKYLSLFFIPFLITKIIEKYDLKKCENIIKDIKNYLKKAPTDKNGIKSISENEIIDKYSEKYNIDYNTFVKEYLEKLKFLLRNDHSLKESKNINIQGIVITKWELVKYD